jgi:hypothetical protein
MCLCCRFKAFKRQMLFYDEKLDLLINSIRRDTYQRCTVKL